MLRIEEPEEVKPTLYCALEVEPDSNLTETVDGVERNVYVTEYNGEEQEVYMKAVGVRFYVVTDPENHTAMDIELSDDQYEITWDEGALEALNGFAAIKGTDVGEYTWNYFNLDANQKAEVRSYLYANYPNGIKWHVTLTDESLASQYAEEIEQSVSINPGMLRITEPVEGPAFVNEALDLRGEIGVVFYLYLPELEGVEYNRVDFWIKEGEHESVLSQSVAYGKEDRDDNALLYTDWYNFHCYMTSIEMADQITAILYYTVNGEERTLTREPYALKDFFDKYDANKDKYPEVMQNAIEAVADLGYYAQILAQHKLIHGEEVPAWILGEDHVEMDKFYHTYSTADVEAAKAELADYEFSYELQDPNKTLPFRFRYALQMDTTTVMNLYLAPRPGFDIGEVHITDVKIDGKSLTDKVVEDDENFATNGYRIDYTGVNYLDEEYPGILSIELYRAYTIEVTVEYNGETYGFTGELSPYSCILQAILEGERLNDIHRVNFYIAAYRYGKYAKSMWEAINPE